MRNVKDLLFLSDITHGAAILYLPFLLRQTPDQFFERPEHNQPRILVTRVDFTGYDMLVDEKSIFHVKVENIVICRCTDFVYAFKVMIALHYVFNVTYSKKIEATMILIRRLFLEIHDSQKIPSKVPSLICRIKKDM